ncbi:hypothetical protein QQF64_008326 [Cirrhinus molitorella]|uniref:Uncharacterized protein n=1 Tax=Cirrhinus molitorella TaxID=172907 RepID=A0ABR3M8U4_9TELE
MLLTKSVCGKENFSLFPASVSSSFPMFSPSKPTLGSQSQQTDHQSPMSALRETIQAVVCEGRSLSLEPGLMGSIARVAGAAQREREALICHPNGSRRLSHCKEHG